MFTIYLIVNNANGKVYVGQTRQKLDIRWRRHINNDLRPGAKHPIKSAIHKYGFQNFTIHRIDSADTQEQANLLEETWIFLMNSRVKSIGYNIKPGGDNHAMSEETKKKISDGIKKNFSEGRRKKPELTPELRAAFAHAKGPDNFNFRHDLPCPEYFVFLCNNGISTNRIAKHFKTTAGTIFKKMKATGLEYRTYTSASGSPTGHGAEWFPVDEDRLREYCEQGLSTPKIGAIFGCSYNVIRRRMNSLGLKRNKKKP